MVHPMQSCVGEDERRGSVGLEGCQVADFEGEVGSILGQGAGLGEHGLARVDTDHPRGPESFREFCGERARTAAEVVDDAIAGDGLAERNELVEGETSFGGEPLVGFGVPDVVGHGSSLAQLTGTAGSFGRLPRVF